MATAPTYYVYLDHLYEVRIGLSSSAYNYSRLGWIDASWMENDPWLEIAIPTGTPINQHIGTRQVKNGLLRSYNDKEVDRLLRNTDVRATVGSQYLVGSTSYYADYAVFLGKGLQVTVADGSEAEETVAYSFTKFRVQDVGPVKQGNRYIHAIYFKADSVARSEP